MPARTGSWTRHTEGTRAMTPTEIARLEHAGRMALAWAPERDDGHPRFAPVLAAAGSAAGILAVAVSILLNLP